MGLRFDHGKVIIINITTRYQYEYHCKELEKLGYRWRSKEKMTEKPLCEVSLPMAFYIEANKEVGYGSRQLTENSLFKPFTIAQLKNTYHSTNNIMPPKTTPKASDIKVGATFINQYGHQVTVTEIYYTHKEVSGFKFNDGETAGPGWTFRNMKFIKNPGPTPKAPKANFLLKYDLDEDPIEEYETMKQVDDRIKYLVENVQELKKESIVIYEIKKKHRVTISTRITKRNA